MAHWIWDNLVPSSGQCASIQGELLRAVEKLRWEALENGNINWDPGFVNLAGFIEVELLQKSLLQQADKATIANDLQLIKEFGKTARVGNSEIFCDDIYDRLSHFVVKFCRLNPRLIHRDIDPNQYR